jgi:putative glutamine amidotransferase
MAPPVIGITAYVEQAAFTVWDIRVALIPYWYVQRVADAGGLAVLLPPLPGSDALLDRLDGLILSGGADIAPEAYGAARHQATSGLRPDRDAAELPLARAALDRDLPILGICRGMQLLAIACGGSLHQHLPDLARAGRPQVDHCPKPESFGTHGVRFAEQSRLHRLLGEVEVVPTHHHQAVADPGSLTVTGWAEDGVVEAVEDPERPFLIGVQWHPEAGEDPRLFDALVAAARARSDL